MKSNLCADNAAVNLGVHSGTAKRLQEVVLYQCAAVHTDLSWQ